MTSFLNREFTVVAYMYFLKYVRSLSQFSVAPWDDVLYSFTVGARFFGPFQADAAEVLCSS